MVSLMWYAILAFVAFAILIIQHAVMLDRLSHDVNLLKYWMDAVRREKC